MKKINLLLAVLFIAFTAMAQQVPVNSSNSELKWTGKKVTGEHWGFIKLKDGSLKIEDNKIIGGEFNIDMISITCSDLEDAEWNEKLIGHLKSDDFFSVEKYPVANLKITEGSAFKNGEAKINGKLTIKGITKPISFMVKETEKAYMASISVDRTLYEVRYGSGKFFDNLGDNMIDDEFILDVKIMVQ
jgi:polyisoprenoid-binding protein YceI